MQKFAFLIILLFAIACNTETPAPAPLKDLAPCSAFTDCTFYVEVPINGAPFLATGNCEECFDRQANMTLEYEPASGYIAFHSDIEICPFFFEWLPTDCTGAPGAICEIPPHEWQVSYNSSPGAQKWQGAILFEPNDCIADNFGILQFRFQLKCQ